MLSFHIMFPCIRLKSNLIKALPFNKQSFCNASTAQQKIVLTLNKKCFPPPIEAGGHLTDVIPLAKSVKSSALCAFSEKLASQFRP